MYYRFTGASPLHCTHNRQLNGTDHAKCLFRQGGQVWAGDRLMAALRKGPIVSVIIESRMDCVITDAAALWPRGWAYVVDPVEPRMLAASSSSPSPPIIGHLKKLSTFLSSTLSLDVTKEEHGLLTDWPAEVAR